MKHKFRQIALIVASMTGFINLANAESMNLSLQELDQLTAGGANEAGFSGGAVVSGGSSATLEELGSISIADEAQNAIEALNIVNSSASVVVNGVNVWDNISEAGTDTVGPQILQDNNLFQVMNRVASLPSYERSAENIDQSWEVSESYGSSGYQNETVDINESFTSSEDFSTSGEVSVDAPVTVTSTDESAVNGESAAVVGELLMPTATASIEFTGTGCAAVNGQCSSVSETTSSSQGTGDYQGGGTFESGYDDSGSYTDSGNSSQKAPLLISGVMAEYIAVDDSELQVSNQYDLNMGGTAQSNVSAINVVNSSGSAVANGVNVGRSTGGSSPAGVTQTNFTTQYR